MPAERFSIRVTKDYLIFCCGHFITFDGSDCERLHGHNYRVAVEVVGPLDVNWYVFDFVALKNRAKEVVDELDHHMLLATKNPQIAVEQVGENVVARFGTKEWSFPREDCVLLPIENTTAELLAKWVAGRLREVIHTRHGFTPDILRVEVEETFGQSATYEWHAAG